jgi:hypothetical protein
MRVLDGDNASLYRLEHLDIIFEPGHHVMVSMIMSSTSNQGRSRNSSLDMSDPSREYMYARKLALDPRIIAYENAGGEYPPA